MALPFKYIIISWISEICNPWYGNPVETYFKSIENIPTWEQCGHICHEDQSCESWSWNVPDNQCWSEKGCKSCKLSNDTKRYPVTDKNWISGHKNCYSSAGSSNPNCSVCPGNKVSDGMGFCDCPFNKIDDGTYFDNCISKYSRIGFC